MKIAVFRPLCRFTVAGPDQTKKSYRVGKVLVYLFEPHENGGQKFIFLVVHEGLWFVAIVSTVYIYRERKNIYIAINLSMDLSVH